MTDIVKQVQKFTSTEDKTVFEVMRLLKDKYALYISLITENGLFGTDQYYLKHPDPEIRQMWIEIPVIASLFKEIEELVIWMDSEIYLV